MDSMTDIKEKGKVVVVGVGGSGVGVLNCLHAMSEAANLDLVAIDTDERSLNESPVTCKIAAGFKWSNGLGCGGEVIKAQRAVATERPKIRKAIEGASLVIVVGGLGGGTGTSGGRIVAGSAKDKGIPVITIMTTPFAFEGQGRRKVCDDAIGDILVISDVFLPIPNDLLYSMMESDASLEEAFKLADLEVARSVFGVSEMLRCRNLLSSDFADLKSVLNRVDHTCSVGVGVSTAEDGEHRCHAALERMINSPLLGGSELVNDADVLFVSLIGGSDLEIGETKKTFEAIERMAGANSRVIVGANTDSLYDGIVQLTIVTAKYLNDKDKEVDTVSLFTADKPKTQKIVRKNSRLKEKEFDPEGQLEFDLQPISRGLFTNTEPTNYNHEDLDIPTFQRRGEIIDQGT